MQKKKSNFTVVSYYFKSRAALSSWRSMTQANAHSIKKMEIGQVLRLRVRSPRGLRAAVSKESRARATHFSAQVFSLADCPMRRTSLLQPPAPNTHTRTHCKHSVPPPSTHKLGQQRISHYNIRLVFGVKKSSLFARRLCLATSRVNNKKTAASDISDFELELKWKLL